MREPRFFTSVFKEGYGHAVEGRMHLIPESILANALKTQDQTTGDQLQLH